MNPAPMPYVTGLYAGLIALLLLWFAALISRRRMQLRVGLGDGGNVQMQRAIRVHANAVEWALPYLLLLLIAELNRASPWIVHALGIVLIVGRVLHGIGLSRTSGESFGRMVGTSLTWTGVALLALYDIWAGLRMLML